MNRITKALVGGVAAGAMALTAAAPAQAQSRHRDYDRGGISAGEIIAGALIIGGIAAVASAASNNRSDRYRGGYDRGGYNRGYYNDTPRAAVEQCVHAARDSARRHSWGGQARVTEIRNVSNHRDGYNVRGRIEVNTRGRNWDSGNFTCQIRHGRISKLNYSGIRGL